MPTDEEVKQLRRRISATADALDKIPAKDKLTYSGEDFARNYNRLHDESTALAVKVAPESWPPKAKFDREYCKTSYMEIHAYLGQILALLPLPARVSPFALIDQEIEKISATLEKPKPRGG